MRTKLSHVVVLLLALHLTTRHHVAMPNLFLHAVRPLVTRSLA